MCLVSEKIETIRSSFFVAPCVWFFFFFVKCNLSENSLEKWTTNNCNKKKINEIQSTIFVFPLPPPHFCSFAFPVYFFIPHHPPPFFFCEKKSNIDKIRQNVINKRRYSISTFSASTMATSTRSFHLSVDRTFTGTTESSAAAKLSYKRDDNDGSGSRSFVRRICRTSKRNCKYEHQ